jgi:hypothetical protein
LEKKKALTFATPTKTVGQQKRVLRNKKGMALLRQSEWFEAIIITKTFWFPFRGQGFKVL